MTFIKVLEHLEKDSSKRFYTSKNYVERRLSYSQKGRKYIFYIGLLQDKTIHNHHTRIGTVRFWQDDWRLHDRKPSKQKNKPSTFKYTGKKGTLIELMNQWDVKTNPDWKIANGNEDKFQIFAYDSNINCFVLEYVEDAYALVEMEFPFDGWEIETEVDTIKEK